MSFDINCAWEFGKSLESQDDCKTSAADIKVIRFLIFMESDSTQLDKTTGFITLVTEICAETIRCYRRRRRDAVTQTGAQRNDRGNHLKTTGTTDPFPFQIGLIKFWIFFGFV